MEINEFKDFLSILPKPNQSTKPQPNQSNLSKTKVLLMNLNTTMTELAKSLIYKGIHLYLYDSDAYGNKSKITKKDVTNNYYLKKEDINKERIQVLYQQLIPLNISVSITILDDINNVSLIRGLTIACVGFSTFKSMSYYEDYFTRKGIVFYCINNSGIFGFFYNNLKETLDKKKRKMNVNIKQAKNNISSHQRVYSLFESSSVLSSSRSSISTIKEFSPQPYIRSNIKVNNKHICINTLLFNKKEDLFLSKIKSEDKTPSCYKRNKNEHYLSLIIYLIEIYNRKNVNAIHKENNNDKFQKQLFFINNYLNLNRLNCYVENSKFQIILK